MHLERDCICSELILVYAHLKTKPSFLQLVSTYVTNLLAQELDWCTVSFHMMQAQIV